MPSKSDTKHTSRLVTLITVVIVVAVLYWAREVAIPLALAVLLSFLLAPLVIRVQRWGLGRIPAVALVTVMCFMLLGALAWIISGEVMALADNLPQYKNNIREKIQSLSVEGPWSRASENIKEMTEEVLKAATAPESKQGEPVTGQSDIATPQQPLPVAVYEKPRNALEGISLAVAPLLGPLASAGIVIVFVIFMLVQREDLRDRVIRLIGQGQLTVTTQAIDEAATRVSRYLLMQLVVNATYGIPVGIGLFLLGIPNALLWGVLAILLRFIPYVGPWLAASMPIALSLAVSENWTTPMLVIGMFIALELISNNLIEPWLYGSGTGVSPVAILVAAVFWTWLWGAPGLVLATPLTVCLVVIGRYVPQLEFFTVLLGDQPSLTPAERVYQRLLALDYDEAFELAQQQLKEKTLLEAYEQVLLPALRLAESDRHHGRLEESRDRPVYQGMRALIDELAERARDSADEGEQTTPRASARLKRAAQRHACRILILPARDEADELAGLMLAHLLEREAVEARAVGVDALASEMLKIVEQQEPLAVCISALPPMAVMHSRYLCKRLLARFNDLKVIVGLWTMTDLKQAEERISICGARAAATTFSQAMEQIRGLEARTTAAA